MYSTREYVGRSFGGTPVADDRDLLSVGLEIQTIMHTYGVSCVSDNMSQQSNSLAVLYRQIAYAATWVCEVEFA